MTILLFQGVAFGAVLFTSSFVLLASLALLLVVRNPSALVACTCASLLASAGSFLVFAAALDGARHSVGARGIGFATTLVLLLVANVLAGRAARRRLRHRAAASDSVGRVQ